MRKLLNRGKNKLQRMFAEKKPEMTAPFQSPTFHCPVCNQPAYMLPLPTMYFAKLQEHRCIHNIFLAETINLEHYSCANCGASDRDRLYALFLENFLTKPKNVALLDIAPADQLARFVKKFANVQYRSSDLYMPGVDDVQDITNMHLYAQGQFDFFICSHVLEHIPDDLKAMAELYRVLKKGGKGIVMVPINLGLEKTLEDPTITDIATRWKLFGQDDHVRMYSKKDFIHRLTEAGFTVELLDKDYFGETIFQQAAIFSGSVLYIVTK